MVGKLWKVYTKEFYLIMKIIGSVDISYTVKPSTFLSVKEANFERPLITYFYVKEWSTNDKSLHRSGSHLIKHIL